MLTAFSVFRALAPTSLAVVLVGGLLLAPSFTTGVILRVIDDRAEMVERRLARVLVPVVQAAESGSGRKSARP